MKKHRWQRPEKPNENTLMSIQEVAKLIRKADDYVCAAMDEWTQTAGRRGLKYVMIGKRRNIRYKSIGEWLEREEEAMACRRAAM